MYMYIYICMCVCVRVFVRACVRVRVCLIKARGRTYREQTCLKPCRTNSSLLAKHRPDLVHLPTKNGIYSQYI